MGTQGISFAAHEKDLTLTVVNLHVSQACKTEIGVRGARLKSGSATTLTHSDIHAHNTFDQRDVVIPQTKGLEVKGRTLNYAFPPASVTKLTLTLS